MATAMLELANDRFKSHFANWFWWSVALATILHFVTFALWPQMSVLDVSSEERALTTIDLPPDIEIPPPPQAIARPATPVVNSAVLNEEITIPGTTFADHPVTTLPPPPAATSSASANQDLADAPFFTPRTLEPELKNSAAVEAALQRNYPPMLRDAGIGGRSVVWFFIDEDGRVVKTQLSKSSGYDTLDQVALKVAEIMQFSPAQNLEKKVPVWVAIEIVFTAK